VTTHRTAASSSLPGPGAAGEPSTGRSRSRPAPAPVARRGVPPPCASTRSGGDRPPEGPTPGGVTRAPRSSTATSPTVTWTLLHRRTCFVHRWS